MEIKTKEINGITYINTTSHPINLWLPEWEEPQVIPPCGILINAQATEEPAGTTAEGRITLVRVRFTTDEKSERFLSQLEKQYPGAIIIGSLIAAQAFPSRVYAMCPAPGFERVEPARKRMLANKFTIF